MLLHERRHGIRFADGPDSPSRCGARTKDRGPSGERRSPGKSCSAPSETTNCRFRWLLLGAGRRWSFSFHFRGLVVRVTWAALLDRTGAGPEGMEQLFRTITPHLRRSENGLRPAPNSGLSHSSPRAPCRSGEARTRGNRAKSALHLRAGGRTNGCPQSPPNIARTPGVVGHYAPARLSSGRQQPLAD